MSTSDILAEAVSSSVTKTKTPLSSILGMLAGGAPASVVRPLLLSRVLATQCKEYEERAHIIEQLDYIAETYNMRDVAERMKITVLSLVRQEARACTDASFYSFKSQLSVDMMTGAPEGLADLKVPLGFVVKDDGVYSVANTAGSQTRITSVPVALLSRVASAENSVQFRVAWLDTDGHWRTAVCERRNLLDANRLLDLVNIGFPASTANNKQLVKYFSKFEDDNIMPTEHISHSLGWIQNKAAFLVGNRVIGDPGHEVTFTPLDGMSSFANHFHPAGTLEGWYEAVREACSTANSPGAPRFFIGLYAALASPLLEILSPNQLNTSFIVDFSFSAGKGKTVCLRGAASVWGKPERGDGIINTWATTYIGVETMAITANQIGVCIDDSRQIENKPEMLEEIIYGYCSGKARTRGAKGGGNQVGHAWHGIMISTSERPLNKYTKGDGVNARVLCVHGAVTPSSDIAERIEAGLLNNYGHFGPRWIEFLISQRSAWPEWQAKYEEMYNEAKKRVRVSSATRLLKFVVALDFARSIAEGIGLPRGPLTPNGHSIAMAYAVAATQTADAGVPRNVRAVDDILNTILTHKDRFPPKGKTCRNINDTPLGFLAVENGANVYYFYMVQLRRWLFRANYNADEVISALQEYNLISSSDAQTTNVEGISVQLLRIEPIELSTRFQALFQF
jgi:hypothetical protein